MPQYASASHSSADLQVQNQGNRFFGPLNLSRKSAQAMDEIHEDPRFCSLRQDRQNLNLSSCRTRYVKSDAATAAAATAISWRGDRANAEP